MSVKKDGSLGETFRIVWPLVFAMASYAAMQFTDRVFLARYTELAIQAAMPAGILSFLFVGFFQAVVGYSGTFVSQFHGAGLRMSCARAFAQGCWLSLACIPFILLLIPVGHGCMALAGHAPEVIAEEKRYYDALMIGGFLVPFSAALSGFFTGRGYTRLVMCTNIAGNILNVLLDYLLIYGKWGFPEWGIAGAAWATVFSLAFTMLLLGVAVAKDETLNRWRRFRVAFALNVSLCKRILRFGLPAGFHIFLDVLFMTIFVMVTGRLGALSLAVSNICFSLNNLVFSPLLGIGMGASILVGQYQGNANPAGAVRAGRSALLIGFVYMTLSAIVLCLLNQSMLMLFWSDTNTFNLTEYLALGRILTCIFITWGFFDAVSIILGGALKGAGDTRFVMLMMAGTALLIWMPSVVGVMYLGGGIVALWCTLPVYVTLLAGFILWRWRSGSWKRIKMIQAEDRV